jgi:hypothetical protein
LTFGLSETACLPVNKILSEVIRVFNQTVSKVTVLHKRPSHVINLEMSQAMVISFFYLSNPEKALTQINVSLNVVYSTKDPITNVICIVIDGTIPISHPRNIFPGYTFPVTFNFVTELAQIYSYEEIEQLVKGQPEFAKSQNPVWLVQWRGIDVIVKWIRDAFSGPNEVELHK